MKDCLSEGGVATLALLCFLEISIDGDRTVGSRHLQFDVDVTRPRHELGESWTPKDGVVSTLEGDYFETEMLSAIVCLRSKSNLKLDASHGFGLFSQHDTMKLDFVVVKLALRQVHALQGVFVQDVEAAASVHQHLGQSEVVDNWVDDESLLAGVRHVVWVVFPVPCDWLFGPVQVLGNIWHRGVELT